MEKGRRQIELLYSLLFTLPGTPVLYYVDKIEMGDNIYLGDHNGMRTPMQWNGDRNAGFSQADLEQLCFPLIAGSNASLPPTKAIRSLVAAPCTCFTPQIERC
jgi:maltose alpha-D-glucosyltransferase/alpha-amylase